jgi:hypothetical protein
VKKVVYDKMIVYKKTKQSTAPWLTQKENSHRHVDPNRSTIQIEGMPFNVPEHCGTICPIKICWIMAG